MWDKPSNVFLSKAAPKAPLHRADKFEGIMLDNGASDIPSGLPAYLRYCKFVGLDPDVRESDRRFLDVGNGVIESLGIATVRLPLADSFCIAFETDILAQDVPLMFILDQHRKHRCSSDEFYNTFIHHPSGTTIPVRYKKGHLYVEWPVSEVLFSTTELKKMHDRFGHPTTRSLVNLLKRARPKQVQSETRNVLDGIVKHCKACQTFAPKPYMFKVSISTDDLVFSHEIKVDLFWIDKRSSSPHDR